MKLTVQQQQYLAAKACWYFDVYIGEVQTDNSDSTVFTGEGVADLDDLIERMQWAYSVPGYVNSKSRFLCDVGSQYSDWRPFDVDDLQAIKTYYIQKWGNVNKPDVYGPGETIGFEPAS